MKLALCRIPSARILSTPPSRLNHPHRLPSRHRLNRLPPFPTVRRAAWPWPCSPPGWSPAASAAVRSVRRRPVSPRPQPLRRRLRAAVQVGFSAAGLHPLAMGTWDSLRVAAAARASGAPCGVAGCFPAGIISGLNRSTTAPNNRALTGMIQTDAPINPGNSGGALLDGRGQLIGVNDSIQSPVEGNVGVGFAIPINRVKAVLPSLEKGVAIQHPWLGISGQTLTAGTADQLGLSEKSGVLVVQVVPGGPSATAGLHADGQASANDDVITAIDGHQITTIEQLTQYLDTKKVGDRVTLTVVRKGQQISVGVTLGNFQAQPSATP